MGAERRGGTHDAGEGDKERNGGHGGYAGKHSADDERKKYIVFWYHRSFSPFNRV